MVRLLDIAAGALVFASMAGFLGYAFHFVWASFHTAPGTSQARALFTSWTVFESSRYTERGRQILRRMWFSLLFGVLSFALALGAKTMHRNAESAEPQRSERDGSGPGLSP